MAINRRLEFPIARRGDERIADRRTRAIGHDHQIGAQAPAVLQDQSAFLLGGNRRGRKFDLGSGAARDLSQDIDKCLTRDAMQPRRRDVEFLPDASLAVGDSRFLDLDAFGSEVREGSNEVQHVDAVLAQEYPGA